MKLKRLKSKAVSVEWTIPALCLIFAIVLMYVKPFLVGRMFHYPVSVPILSESRSGSVLTVLYHERPPYYVTGPLGIYGLCVDPVKKAFSTAGIIAEWVKVPAARQLDMLKPNTPDICAIGWFRNPEREKIAVYSHAIYQDRPMIALARADNRGLVSHRLLAQTFENQALMFLRKDGYSYGPYIDDMILEHGPRWVITTAENVGMLKLIYEGLADYFFISEEEAIELIQTSGLPADAFRFIRFSDMPAGNKRYLLFSRSTDKALVDKVNAAIRQDRLPGMTKKE